MTEDDITLSIPPLDLDHRHREIVAELVHAVTNLRISPCSDECPGIELGMAMAVRAAFVEAGLERVRGMLRPQAWLQLGIAFVDAEQAARFQASGLLRTAVERWRGEGRIGDFWFMHKPPGLRLRFFLREPSAALEAEIRGVLDDARDRGLLAECELGLYDPEIHQFGGAAGLAIFHELSTLDSLGLLRFAELKATGCATIDETVLSLLVIDGLFAAVAEDPWEQWDIWCEMRLTGRLFAPDPETEEALAEALADNRELVERVLLRRDEVIAELHPTEAAIVASHAEGSRRAAHGLETAARAGLLTHPARKLLPFYVVFHWNRCGLDTDQQVALTYFRHRLLDPKR